MKNLYGTVTLLVLAVAIVSCTIHSISGKTGTVTIQKEEIIVHAGTKISKSDEKAFNDVLRKYDKKLYRIETYQDGKLTKTQGALSSVYVEKTVASEAASAKSRGFTDSAIVCLGPNARVQAVPPPKGAKTERVKAQEFIDHLKPILEKYSKP
jgi:hypothetical protein